MAYRADRADDFAMSARKLVYQGLVLGPVVLLGYLGLGARAYSDPFEFHAFSAADEAVMLAYLKPMRQYERLTWSFNTHEKRQGVRSIAGFWVAEFRTGRLKPLPYGEESPSIDSGARDQVLLARARLLASLGRVAEMDENAGRYGAAADDLVLALEVAQIGKQTDLETLCSSARRQSTLVARLDCVTRKLSPEHRKNVALSLVRIAREDHRTIEYLVARRGRVPAKGATDRRTIDYLVSHHGRFPPASAEPHPSGRQVSMLKGAYAAPIPIRVKRQKPHAGTGYLVWDGPDLMLACCFSQEVQYSAMRAMVVRLGVRCKWDYEAWSHGPSESALRG